MHLWLAEQGLTFTVGQLLGGLGLAASGVGTVFGFLVRWLDAEKKGRLADAKACEERLVVELAKQRTQLLEVNKAHAEASKAHAAQHEATQAWFMRQAQGARGGDA